MVLLWDSLKAECLTDFYRQHLWEQSQTPAGGSTAAAGLRMSAGAFAGDRPEYLGPGLSLLYIHHRFPPFCLANS
jgi:hypothetical protein